MNKRELVLQRKKVLKTFHVPGMPVYCKRKVNAVFISPSNSSEHEAMKTEVCRRLRALKCEFITEAIEKCSGLRRDIVCLDTGEIYEVECDPKRAARFKGDVVNVILVDRKSFDINMKVDL